MRETGGEVPLVYSPGTQYPHLSLLIPYLKKNLLIEVIDWEDENVNWLAKKKIILGPIWGYIGNINKFISWLDFIENQHINLINHHKFIKWNLKKNYLLDLNKKNIPVPNTLLIESKSEISFEEAKDLFFKNFQQSDIILKGVVDSGSSGYLHVCSSKINEANDHFEKLKEKNHGVIIQNFIPEIQNKGEFSFVFLGGKISHFFIKVPKHNEERVQPFYGGKSFHINNKNIEKQIRFIKSSFRSDLELDQNEIMNAHDQAQVIYSKLLLLLDEISVPYPKYLRLDGVMINEKFFVMELEGIEPYLEIKEAMENDRSNNVLQSYVENVVYSDAFDR